MDDYRLLTDEEIGVLENNGCTAEDWTSVSVADDFRPAYIRNVNFYGEVFLGVFSRNIEVGKGFLRHSGIFNATLRDVEVGDNCLIENIGNYISNYSIGDECIISNVCLMETTDEPTFGEGGIISVLNEAGSGNVMLFCGLTSNIASLMVRHSDDKELTAAMRKMVRNDIKCRSAERGMIGDRVRIVNTAEITNTHICSNCEVTGACRLSDCTLTAGIEDNVMIGSGVICENSIIADGSAILNNAYINNCYVGESSQITNGFTAESSLFFANSYMANGEACAAFCGPFSSSHHKSSLLIGCMVSFYNAGSGTNFSNHAYKMGPVHYGILERGTKTASGSHLLLPVTTGAFSVCLGKCSMHPDTTSLPFSYIISEGRDTFIVPGKNITSAGLYRDVHKWQRRDVRIYESRKSLINYEWLSPLTVNEMLKGRKLLSELQEMAEEGTSFYTYQGCKISRKSLQRGIRLYDMAIKMFVGSVLNGHEEEFNDCGSALPTVNNGTGEWCDLSGLLMPITEEENIIVGIRNGFFAGVNDLVAQLKNANARYEQYVMEYTRWLVKTYFGMDELTEGYVEAIKIQCDAARKAWLDALKEDALKEYGMGDVEQNVLDSFLTQLEEQRDGRA